MTEQRKTAEAPQRWNPLIDVEQPLMSKKAPADTARPERAADRAKTA
jgi:hypothetical protein